MPDEITTVIPTYRRPRLLLRAIKSVLAQGYPHFQVHVYDNASGDETANIVSRLVRQDSRVKYHVHSHNIGRVENFAYAIAHTQTPFLHILCDDDVIFPEFFETAVSALKREPQAGFFLGGTLYSDFEGNVMVAPFERWNPEGTLRPAQLLNLLLPGNWLSWQATVFRTTILPIIGGFKAGGCREDTDMLLRAAVWCPAIVSRKPCAVAMLHAGDSSLRDRRDIVRESFATPTIDTLEGAIEAAETDGAINHTEAERMLLRCRSQFKRSVLRDGIKLVAQGEIEAAGLAEDALRSNFGHSKLADVVKVVRSTGSTGQFSRIVLRALKTTRRSALTFLNNYRHRGHTSRVKETYGQLSGDISAIWDGGTRRTVP